MHGHVLLSNPRTGIFNLLAFKPTEYAPEEFVPKAVVNHSMISVDAPKAYAEYTTRHADGIVRDLSVTPDD